ncbi:DUF4369 domain-containing protein [Oceanihabitans sp. 2_MG-2023]|uniref:DUF4369 domain-containing protein n=1 Tax=Oceanihabitans sp. 2_MG-2023 TaxID=3062661 RepID=UPI0026E2A629|nr:DUF4369 domain-containing protein [Oceanihabitans sp. 2_MG-2023]MDO6597587.1 DUF4369 domain-containing protein [Oceanihabitans sp. 2_MG-2023]
MKKTIFVLALAILCSCGKEKDLTVKLNIKGLKKGTVYLKKAQDTTIITVDSLVIQGESPIIFNSELETPEMYFLQLDKNTSEDETISFFADKGITEINTTVKNFGIDAKIKGSKQQKALEEYLLVMSRFNNKNLDLIKEEFEAKVANDTAKILANTKAYNSLLKSKYLYTVNFAITNKDNEIAPYLALTEIADAQTKWLDTINKVLTPKVKASKYGKELDAFLIERKKEND